MAYDIVSINIGKPVKIDDRGKELRTGIFKTPVDEPIYLGTFNFDGDGQADLVNHGGKDKAVCVYPFDHYTYWEKDLQRSLDYGAFGENLTVYGIREEEVCIGDTFKLGEAVVQISQPRQPCHKLAKKYQIPDLPVRVQQTGFTGFYFRVLEEGMVSVDAPIELLDRHIDNVTVSFANHIMHIEKQNIEGIHRLLEVKELADDWRHSFEKRLKKINS